MKGTKGKIYIFDPSNVFKDATRTTRITAKIFKNPLRLVTSKNIQQQSYYAWGALHLEVVNSKNINIFKSKINNTLSGKSK